MLITDREEATVTEEQCNEVETRVREALQRVGTDTKGTNRVWTEAVKIALASIGKEFGYQTCTSIGARGRQPEVPPSAEYPEWLWDLTWVAEEKNSESRDLIDLPLALESEWSENLEGGILPDFQKLLVSRARLRVMVMQAKNGATANSYFQRLIMRFAGMRERGLAIATYMLVGSMSVRILDSNSQRRKCDSASRTSRKNSYASYGATVCRQLVAPAREIQPT